MVNVNPGDVIFNSGQVSNIESELLIALAEIKDCRIVSAKTRIKAAIGIVQAGNVVERP